MTRLLIAALLVVASSASADVYPEPSADNPRLQTVHWKDGETFALTALPQSGLTIMLEPGERISRAILDVPGRLDLRVSSERDSVLVIPVRSDADEILLLETDLRRYRFRIRVATGLMSAYLVRFLYTDTPEIGTRAEPPAEIQEAWSYRIRGDRAVVPLSVTDDGQTTQITFADDQDLPAVFAIGSTGDEQAVNGHMRANIYVIDRVWNELVFRLDDKMASARRNPDPDPGSTRG